MSKLSVFIKINFTAILIYSANIYSATLPESPRAIKGWIYENSKRAAWVDPETKLDSGVALDSSIDELSNIVWDLRKGIQLEIAKSLVLTAANLNYMIVRAALAVLMNDKVKTLEDALKESEKTVQKQIKGIKTESGVKLEDALSDGEKYIVGTCMQELVPLIRETQKKQEEYFELDYTDDIVDYESQKIAEIKKALLEDDLKNNLDLVFNHEKDIDRSFEKIKTDKQQKIAEAKKQYYTMLLTEVPNVLKNAMKSNNTKLVSAIIGNIAKLNTQSEIVIKLYENILNLEENEETLLHYYARNESTKDFISDIFVLMKKVVDSKKGEFDKQKFTKDLLLAKCTFSIDDTDSEVNAFELAASWQTDIAAAILEETIELTTDLYKPGQNDIINEMAQVMQVNCWEANELLKKIPAEKLKKTIILDPAKSIYNKLKNYVNSNQELDLILKNNSFGQYINIDGIKDAFMGSVDTTLKIFGCSEDDVTLGNLVDCGYIINNNLLLKFENKGGILQTISNPVTEKSLEWKTYFKIDDIIFDGETGQESDLFSKAEYAELFDLKPPFFDNTGEEIYTDGVNDYHEENVKKPDENPLNPMIRKINIAVVKYNEFAKEFNRLYSQEWK